MNDNPSAPVPLSAMLGRWRSKPTLLSLNAQTKRLLATDPERWSVIIQCTAGNAILYFGDDGDGNAGNGILIASGGVPLALTYRDFGILVQGQIWCKSAGLATVVCFESLWR